MEGSIESILTGLVPNDTLFPAEGAHYTASAPVLSVDISLMGPKHHNACAIHLHCVINVF